MTPEAVAHAMKVLEIHEKLEHPDNPGDSDEPADRLGDNEVEVLKEMCNVSACILCPSLCMLVPSQVNWVWCSHEVEVSPFDPYE